MKYRRELTPDIKFQADSIFVRNDLFEQVIKSCKATSAEFLMLKEKIGICSYVESIEELFEVTNEKSTKELSKKLDEESDNEPIEVIGKVSNEKSTKKLTKELNKKLDDESDEESDETFKISAIKRLQEALKKREEESIKDLKEATGLNNKSTAN